MNQQNIQIWDDIYPYEFFLEDIENKCLYILETKEEIVSAFALSRCNEGEKYVEWKNKNAAALYIDRFGVNVNYLRQGIGSIMLGNAITIAKKRGVNYLRLFVVDINQPAINLYIKKGFQRVEGIYDEIIDDTLTLHEYGFKLNI